MTRGVVAISTGTAIDTAAQRMRERGIHHLVVKDGQALAGVVSARALGSGVGRTVADAMTPAIVVDATATIRQVANTMRGRVTGCVVVIERGKPVGVITISDLLELLGRGIDRPGRPERRGLHHRVPHRRRKSGGSW